MLQHSYRKLLSGKVLISAAAGISVGSHPLGRDLDCLSLIQDLARDSAIFLHLGAKDKNIEYGYYHGYTLFDKNGTEPHFPFGFGLSYTEFSLDEVAVSKDSDKISVTVKVINKGAFDGDEVIQIYIGSENKDADRPVKVLKGFKRISVKAGETVEATVNVEIDDIKFYCPENGEWKLDENYSVYVGTDSKNVIMAGKISF